MDCLGYQVLSPQLQQLFNSFFTLGDYKSSTPSVPTQQRLQDSPNAQRSGDCRKSWEAARTANRSHEGHCEYPVLKKKFVV